MSELFRMKQPEGIDFARHMERLRKIQELRAETALWRDETSVHVDTKGMPYFCLMPLADLHIGAAGCDMEALAEHLTYLKEYGVSTVLVGDLGDFFSPDKHPEGMLGDVIPPDDQMLLLRRFMQEYKDNILAVVQDSSHPDWVRQSSGIEPYRWMSEDLGIPLLNNGATIDLTVNNQRYSVGCYHEIARYNSSFNRTHALKRMRELDHPTDVVIGAHRHIGAIEKAVHQDDKPTFVQLGTFKVKDGFGTRRGMVPSPQIFFPTLFFDGRKHNIEAVENLEAAEEMIEALHSHYTLGAVARLGL